MRKHTASQSQGSRPIALKRPDPAPFRKTKDGKGLLEFVCAYDFHNEHGELIFQKLRYRLVEGEGRDKELFYRRPRGERSWTPRKPENADHYLYRLPEVLRAVRRGWTVYWPEGEKDCNSLRATGVTATSHHGGAGKVSAEQCAWLRGAAEVRLLADRDPAGAYDALRRYKGLLEHAGLKPRQVRVLRAAKGKDVTDHLAAGYGLADLVPVSLNTLRRKAKEYSKETALRAGYAYVGITVIIGGRRVTL